MNRRACAAHRQCRSKVRVRTWNAPAACARPVRAMRHNLRRVSCGAYRQRSSDVHEQLELLHDLRAEDVVERGEHSEGERRGSYATASARSCPARATGLMVRMREGAQHGGRVTICYRCGCCTMHVAGSGEGGQVAEANFPNSPCTREVRNARRYETAKPHQDSQGRARTSAARGEGMPQGCTIGATAPRGHRGRCKADAKMARVTARAKSVCKADVTRAGATARAGTVQRRPDAAKVGAMPSPRERGWCNADATWARGDRASGGIANRCH